MAPGCPEEVDVFTVPHSRMKELVCQYLDMLTATNFSDVTKFTMLLGILIRTFNEFIAHEQIENQFIMKKLKNKLRSLSIQNTAVCNCHKDNSLSDMLSLLQDGYKCTKKTEADRRNFGLQLRQSLEEFTETFLPHMAEEEEVFQPLLMEYFTVDELKQIKATVIQKHFCAEPEDMPEKFVNDNKSSKPIKNKNAVPEPPVYQPSLDALPDEALLQVFSHLDVQGLARCAQVSHRWNQIAMDGSLWTQLYPVSWSRGDWSATCGIDEEVSQDVASKLEGRPLDEDADIDEADTWDTEAQQIQHESSMLTSMCRYLLPRVGRSVQVCDLAYSKGLTNGTLYKFLSLCPNLEHLDLSQTRVSDLGFKGFKKGNCGHKLRHLDLSGCLYITDLTLSRLSTALGQIPCHMTDSSSVIGHAERLEEDETKNRVKETIVEKSETDAPEKKSMVSSCNDQQKSAFRLNKCCGKDLKSQSASHSHCTRAGPCKIGSGCDVGLPNRGSRRRSLSCGGCGNMCGRDEPEMTCDVGSRQIEVKNLAETQKSVQNKLRDALDPGKGNRLPPAWTGSTVENLEILNESILNVTIDIQPSNTTKSKAQTDLKKSHKFFENTPSDLNLAQTQMPDFILFPKWETEVMEKSENELNQSQITETKHRLLDCKDNDNPGQTGSGRILEFLSLSGCYQITDEGLEHMIQDGGLPHLHHLDLSGCLNVTGEVIADLVTNANKLSPAHLFFCDNIEDGPYPEEASGCQNLQSKSRVCCRCGE
ncbi:F-box/LRR-repeat protein 5-like [Mya arenaria]|uniref:F-box/LRR-repeat protein 5-like n=1 Tax=Mya arenaria TaxID=6604 RepID=UPI0022E5DFF2|nr:F-box/LRR-repeat protein 5-like [Mya arenaria]